MPLPSPPTPTGLACAPQIAIVRDPAAIEPLWRRFEAENPGRLFQRYDWVSAWCATQARARAMEPAIVVACDAAGEPTALMPFGVRGVGQTRIVEWLGGVHSTYNMPLILNGGPRFAGRFDAREFLRVVGRAIGDVDAFALVHQPVEWDGRPHPFRGVADSPAADRAFERSLGGDGEALIKRLLSSESRRKLRIKEKRLSDLGPVMLRRAATGAEAQSMVATFLAQKEARFRTQAFHNAFAEDDAPAFLEAAATQGLAEGAPGIALYALMAGDRLLALFGGPEDGARFSAMFTSFDGAPEIGRNSPGDVLLRHLVSALSNRGVAYFDLGMGDARYKFAYCDRFLALFETHLACSTAGIVVATAFGVRTAAKRRLKQNPALLRIARRVMRRGGE